MDLGPHAFFIWTSYVVVAAAMTALVGWLVFDGNRLARIYESLEKRGAKRRSAGESSPKSGKDVGN